MNRLAKNDWYDDKPMRRPSLIEQAARVSELPCAAEFIYLFLSGEIDEEGEYRRGNEANEPIEPEDY